LRSGEHNHDAVLHLLYRRATAISVAPFATLKVPAMMALTRKLLQHLLPGVVRPLHILWNQIIGFFFLVLALIPIPSAVRSYNDPDGYPRLIMTVIFIVLMAGFSISSFFRARKIARS